MERSERVATSVTPEFKHEIRVLAAESDMTMSEFMRVAIEEKIERCRNEGNLSAMTTALS